eukprot:372572-Pleurochrysis_carterae.AAC.1
MRTALLAPDVITSTPPSSGEQFSSHSLCLLQRVQPLHNHSLRVYATTLTSPPWFSCCAQGN